MSDYTEQLLYNDESDSLDFKQQQYLFDRASDPDKAKLLKDVLAFANSWRRTEAYILIGISEERRHGRKTVIGIDQHIDDAKLQEFVTSKTQRPITFSYEIVRIDDKEIGILRIPVQDRPFYLRKDFAGLKAGVVYLRRGSCTDIVEPDEIAKMGATAAIAGVGEIKLGLQFGDFEHREIGSQILIESNCLYRTEKDWDVLKQGSIASPIGYWGPIASFDPTRNTEYQKQLYEYVERVALIKPVVFVVKNSGSTSITGAKIQVDIPFMQGLEVVDPDDYPQRPAKSFIGTVTPLSALLARRPSSVSVVRHRDTWRVTVDMGKIRPKDSAWMEEPFYVGSKSNCSLELNARVFAENLPVPSTVPLVVKIKTKIRAITPEDLQSIEQDSE